MGDLPLEQTLGFRELEEFRFSGEASHNRLEKPARYLGSVCHPVEPGER